ncbi:hypothetical protein RCL1_003582 [Eukaryota sp. TZLM3-RCL]
MYKKLSGSVQRKDLAQVRDAYLSYDWYQLVNTQAVVDTLLSSAAPEGDTIEDFNQAADVFSQIVFTHRLYTELFKLKDPTAKEVCDYYETTLRFLDMVPRFLDFFPEFAMFEIIEGIIKVLSVVADHILTVSDTSRTFYYDQGKLLSNINPTNLKHVLETLLTSLGDFPSRPVMVVLLAKLHVLTGDCGLAHSTLIPIANHTQLLYEMFPQLLLCFGWTHAWACYMTGHFLEAICTLYVVLKRTYGLSFVGNPPAEQVSELVIFTTLLSTLMLLSKENLNHLKAIVKLQRRVSKSIMDRVLFLLERANTVASTALLEENVHKLIQVLSFYPLPLHFSNLFNKDEGSFEHIATLTRKVRMFEKLQNEVIGGLKAIRIGQTLKIYREMSTMQLSNLTKMDVGDLWKLRSEVNTSERRIGDHNPYGFVVNENGDFVWEGEINTKALEAMSTKMMVFMLRTT